MLPIVRVFEVCSVSEDSPESRHASHLPHPAPHRLLGKPGIDSLDVDIAQPADDVDDDSEDAHSDDTLPEDEPGPASPTTSFPSTTPPLRSSPWCLRIRNAIVTRFADRGRDRHAREDEFQSYDHYLPQYWEYRTFA